MQEKAILLREKRIFKRLWIKQVEAKNLYVKIYEKFKIL